MKGNMSQKSFTFQPDLIVVCVFFSAAGGNWSYNLNHKYGISLFPLNFATFPFALKNMTNICKSD